MEMPTLTPLLSVTVCRIDNGYIVKTRVHPNVDDPLAQRLGNSVNYARDEREVSEVISGIIGQA